MSATNGEDSNVAEPHRRGRPRGPGIGSRPGRASNPDEQLAVSPGRDEAFHELWAKTARYFTAQPGFISLRLHRAVSADAQYRWVNVANWESEAHFRAAHGTGEFRRVVTQPGWEEFPSSPMLYQVVTEAG